MKNRRIGIIRIHCHENKEQTSLLDLTSGNEHKSRMKSFLRSTKRDVTQSAMPQGIRSEGDITKLPLSCLSRKQTVVLFRVLCDVSLLPMVTSALGVYSLALGGDTGCECAIISFVFSRTCQTQTRTCLVRGRLQTLLTQRSRKTLRVS